MRNARVGSKPGTIKFAAALVRMRGRSTLGCPLWPPSSFQVFFLLCSSRVCVCLAHSENKKNTIWLPLRQRDRDSGCGSFVVHWVAVFEESSAQIVNSLVWEWLFRRRERHLTSAAQSGAQLSAWRCHDAARGTVGVLRTCLLSPLLTKLWKGRGKENWFLSWTNKKLIGVKTRQHASFLRR